MQTKVLLILCLVGMTLCTPVPILDGDGSDGISAIVGLGVKLGSDSIPSVPTVPSTPSVPTVPSTPSVPTVPTIPSVPTVPSTPNVPSTGSLLPLPC